MVQVGFRARASVDVPSCSPRPFRSTWRPRHDHSPPKPRRPCILSGEFEDFNSNLYGDFIWFHVAKPMPYGHIIYLPVGDDLIRIYGHSGDGNYGLGFIVCRMNQQELGMVLFQKNDGWMMVLFWVMLAGFKEILTLCKLAVLTNQPAGWLVAEAVFAKPLLVVRSPWSSGLYLVNN